MFIAHGERIRKHSRWIFAAILALLIPGFIALFTTSSGSKTREANLPTIHGKPINAGEFEQARNVFQAQYIINTGRELPLTAETRDQLTQQPVLRIVLLRKARELGIRVSDNDVVQHIRNMFVNESGQYDKERQRLFMIQLNTHGISEELFEQVMREDLIMAQLQSLVTSAAKVTPEELRLAYEPLHEKLQIDLVEFNAASNTVPVTVTDDEARAFFQKNKSGFRVPKQMKVRYAFFPTADARKTAKITDADLSEFYDRNKAKYSDTNNVAKPLETVKDTVREDLLQLRADRAAQDRATELTVKLVQEPGGQRPDFAKLCSEFGVTMKETDFFGPTNAIPEIEAGPVFNQVAFSLSPDAPFSDPVPGEGGYYVLESAASKPSEISPFEQIKTTVVHQLKLQKTYEATIKQADEDLTQVKKLIASGKDFDQACAELKLEPKSYGPFAASDEKLDFPAAGQIQQASLGMATNAVSSLIPTEEGGVFFHLRDRKPADPSDLKTGKAEFVQQLLQRDRQMLFSSWLNSLVRTEQVTFGPTRSQPQQPQPEEAPEAEPAAAPTSTPGSATAPAGQQTPSP
jgi:peptidyl-prolyl cis-trans isomerase D